MTINKGIENLRYLSIYIEEMRYEFALDISEHFPKKLTVYNIEYKYKKNIKVKYSGAIIGTNN